MSSTTAMRRQLALPLLALVLSGCTTMTYTSPRSAETVSQCIASGWRVATKSGWELPVTLTWEEDHYFVDLVLVRDFPTFIPIHSMWAKVRRREVDGLEGSSTEYRRNLQIVHEQIDKVVVECQ